MSLSGEDLLPCCENHNINVVTFSHMKPGEFVVRCLSCGFQVYGVGKTATAIKAWNKEIMRYGSHEETGEALTDFIDLPTTFEAVEKEFNIERLDRRRNYCVINGEINFLYRYRRACTGCSDGRYWVTVNRGGGCEECGYHGVVRVGTYVPLKYYNENDWNGRDG